jgi:hypothetical protein
VTPHILDFVGHYSKPLISIRLKGLAKGLNIAGQGRPRDVVDNGYHWNAMSNQGACISCTWLQCSSFEYIITFANISS